MKSTIWPDLQCHPCTELRRVFGEDAPRCGACTKAVETAALVVAGFTTVPRKWLRPYQECGVEVRTSGNREEQLVWVPIWAGDTVEALGVASDLCGPILRRAVVDPEFLACLESVVRLTRVEHLPWLATLRIRIEALARAAGVQPLPPTAA